MFFLLCPPWGIFDSVDRAGESITFASLVCMFWALALKRQKSLQIAILFIKNCDPLCETRLSQSNYEITSIKVWFLHNFNILWLYCSQHYRYKGYIFTDCSLPYEGWFFFWKPQITKKITLAGFSQRGSQFVQNKIIIWYYGYLIPITQKFSFYTWLLYLLLLWI